jgi:hypothetical protein
MAQDTTAQDTMAQDTTAQDTMAQDSMGRVTMAVILSTTTVARWKGCGVMLWRHVVASCCSQVETQEIAYFCVISVNKLFRL